MFKYPIEVEITDFCTLRCDCCPNKSFKSKWYISDENFYKIIDYVYVNHEKILFLDLCGIWDIFLHPRICNYFDYIWKKFAWKKLDILIPTKWAWINVKHIKALHRLKDKWINFNVSFWLYSMRESIHNKIAGHKNFDKMIRIMKLFKKEWLSLSLELLVNKYSFEEIEYFYKFWEALWVNYKIHNYHNFWWSMKNEDIYKYNKKDYKFKCSFADDETYELDFYCKYTFPFIARDGYLFSCSHWWKQERYRVDTISKLLADYPDYEDLLKYVTSEKLNKTVCKDCTYFKY